MVDLKDAEVLRTITSGPLSLYVNLAPAGSSSMRQRPYSHALGSCVDPEHARRPKAGAGRAAGRQAGRSLASMDMASEMEVFVD